MVIHERVHDQRGMGKWDLGTTRYIPMQGGSRSRLPVYDDKNYQRYPGYVGLDERLSETLYTLPTLYAFLGGAPVVPPGQEGGFTALILEQTTARLKEEKAAEEERERTRGA